jgi:carbonyl reductase 1
MIRLAIFRKAKQNAHIDQGYPSTAYGMSKIALTAATFIQQRTFDDKQQRDIIVNACCPGYINTDMTSNKGTGTPSQGADTPVYLATLQSGAKSPRGEFVAERKILKWKC